MPGTSLHWTICTQFYQIPSRKLWKFHKKVELPPGSLPYIPIEEHGFALHEVAFRNAICLRYGWRPPLLPSQCVCNKTFSMEHALSCPCGGFPTIHHNEIRDITAHLMSDVCHNVGIELPLQHISSETMSLRTANVEEGARLDIKTQGF